MLSLLTIGVLSALAGAANSIAGGGTLLTFPALVGLGMPPLLANATSTVALVPGSFFSMVGYREALQGSRAWMTVFAVPSLIGGAVGAWLLVLTPDERFAAIVPFLVLGATIVFLVQKPILRAAGRADGGASITAVTPTIGFAVVQFFVAIYGGYFGAAAGIVMLGTFGLMGLGDIHEMNGLKNWAAICFNGIAALTFIVAGMVDWPVAIVMAIGAGIGGWSAARVAQRIPREAVRRAVGMIGIVAAVWLFLR